MSDSELPQVGPSPEPLLTAKPEARRGPGPAWAWTTAWSLQGGAALLATQLLPEPGWAQFTLMGLGAGLPLLALYLWLRARPESEEYC